MLDDAHLVFFLSQPADIYIGNSRNIPHLQLRLIGFEIVWR